MILAMIRHGQTDDNQKKLIQGRVDNPLNVFGKSQALKIGNTLKTQNINWDFIVSSPLSRAYETARIIKSTLNLEHQIDLNPMFVERDFGSLDGMSIKEAFPLIGNDYQAPDYENDQTLIQRVVSALKTLYQMHKEHHGILVTHSQVIKALLVYMHPDTYSFTNFTIENGQAVFIKVFEHGFELIQ